MNDKRSPYNLIFEVNVKPSVTSDRQKEFGDVLAQPSKWPMTEVARIKLTLESNVEL